MHGPLPTGQPAAEPAAIVAPLAAAIAGPGLLYLLALGTAWALGLSTTVTGLGVPLGCLAMLVALPLGIAAASRPAGGDQGRTLRRMLLLTGALLIPVLWLWPMPVAWMPPFSSLTLALVLLWLPLPVLAATGDHRALWGGPLLGLGLALGAGVAGQRLAGTTGMLWGCALGLGLAASLLLRRSRSAVATRRRAQDPAALFTGVCLVFGLWCDALVAGHGPRPHHGRITLIAHLVMVPALVIALIRTTRACRTGHVRFQAAILRGGDLGSIMTAKQDLAAATGTELARLMQMVILGGSALVLCAPALVDALGLERGATAQVCLDAVGAAVTALLLVVVVLLLAGGWRRSAVQAVAVFAAVALLAALPALAPGGPAAGWGRLAGGALALALALAALRRHLADLEFTTLAGQPLRQDGRAPFPA